MGLFRREPGSEKWIEHMRRDMRRDAERAKSACEKTDALILSGDSYLQGLGESDEEWDTLKVRHQELRERLDDTILQACVENMEFTVQLIVCERHLDRCKREQEKLQARHDKLPTTFPGMFPNDYQKLVEKLDHSTRLVEHVQAVEDDLRPFIQLIEIDGERVFTHMRIKSQEIADEFSRLHEDMEEAVHRLRRHADEELHYRAVMGEESNSELCPDLERVMRKVYG